MIAAAALLLAVVVQQDATEWQYLGEVSGDIMAWDPATATREGDRVLLRLRVAHNPPTKGANAYAITQVEIDCVQSTSRVVEVANYGSDDTRGVVFQGTDPARPIPAGTYVEVMRDAACAAAPAP